MITVKLQAFINNKSDNYYWVYKDGNLESTNCKKSKYRMINSYLKMQKDKSSVKNVSK